MFVFVGGLWSHFYPDSYVKALSGLLGRGIETTRITSHDTRCSVEVNGAVIASELNRIAKESQSKKIIVMAHSKGGLDTLEALRLDPSLASRIDRLVAFQSPFGGSPYAVRYSPFIALSHLASPQTVADNEFPRRARISSPIIW